MGKHYTQAGKTYFEFNNGARVIITPVAPSLVIVIQNQFPEPLPPMIKIENDDGVSFDEENFSDSTYVRKHDAWASDINRRWIDVLLKLGVKVEQVDQVRLGQVKAVMAAQGVPLPDEDNDFQYLKYCLMSDKAETQELINAIQQVSKPEERAIIQALENFSGNVQG